MASLKEPGFGADIGGGGGFDAKGWVVYTVGLGTGIMVEVSGRDDTGFRKSLWTFAFTGNLGEVLWAVCGGFLGGCEPRSMGSTILMGIRRRFGGTAVELGFAGASRPILIFLNSTETDSVLLN